VRISSLRPSAVATVRSSPPIRSIVACLGHSTLLPGFAFHEADRVSDEPQGEGALFAKVLA